VKSTVNWGGLKVLGKKKGVVFEPTKSGWEGGKREEARIRDPEAHSWEKTSKKRGGKTKNHMLSFKSRTQG